jgi:flagellar hook-basal body complex protein FliE
MIDSVSAVAGSEALPQLLGPAEAMGQPGTGASSNDFTNWMARKLDEVNTELSQADMQVRQLAVGSQTNLHEVMIALEKARLGMELVVQVRNKLLDAYQSIMQMQV